MNSFAQQFFDFARSVTPESRFRIAPTPSGFLHVGNAINFILNWLAAKACGGVAIDSPATIFLRIDDLDAPRKRAEYVNDIFETLHWLQLDWQEPPIYQSKNLREYTGVLNRLRETDLLFACRKSRRELEPFGHQYPPEFRNQGLALDDRDVAWRIKTPLDFPLPDFVVRRRDGLPAYQLASFADDLHWGITHIIRGTDLEHSTAAQRYLAQILYEDNFLKIKFLHHPLVLDESGERLSKSAGSTSLRSMIESGIGPEKVLRRVGEWLDLDGETAKDLLLSLQVSLA